VPRDLELRDPIFIKYPLKAIPASIVLPPSSLFHSSMDLSLSTSPKSEDFGFMPSLRFHSPYETSRPLSFTFTGFGHVSNSYD